MKKAFKALRFIIVTLLIGLLACNMWIIFCRFALKDNLPKVFGYCHAIVISGSMEPLLSAGDLIIVKEQPEYYVNDVVMFTDEGSFVTHRIIDKKAEGFITKGDANNTADAKVISKNKIEGKLAFIVPHMGKFLNIMKTPLGMLGLIIAAVAIVEIPNITNRAGKKGAINDENKN